LAAITNGQTNVTLGLALGTTIADGIESNEPVSVAQLNASIAGLLSTSIYGATNQHPVLGAGYASFYDTIPAAQWTNTYALGTSYALVGNRFYTNGTVGPFTLPALSEFSHHVWMNVSALNGGSYYSRVVYVKSDLSATQQVCVGSVVTPVNTNITEQESNASSPTNISLGAGTWYLGVERYAKKNAGAGVALSIYGGNGTPTRLEVPPATSIGGIFLTENDVDAAFIASKGGVTNVTYAAAPACYQITLTNTSAMAYTNNWSPTESVSKITATSTGTVTFVMNWPATQKAYWDFCYDATGMPSTVFPAGAIYFTRGVFSNTAPTLGRSNFVSVLHNCATYQIMVFTNTIGTWGTP
jgi:hypothetical protein